MTFVGLIQAMLWIFVFESPHNGKYDDGNGGAMFFFLGVLLGLLAAPVGGALAVLGVERMITKLSDLRLRRRSAAG